MQAVKPNTCMPIMSPSRIEKGTHADADHPFIIQDSIFNGLSLRHHHHHNGLSLRRRRHRDDDGVEPPGAGVDGAEGLERGEHQHHDGGQEGEQQVQINWRSLYTMFSN